ncbi:MAG: type secretion system tip protein VgrG [Massilia sp.]|nr:type secretion system tip protein VgrG [Massilia sp.]
MPVTQANREVSVKTALATDVLLFRAMSATEQLGRLSEYRVQLLSTDGTLKIGDVLGKPMSVVLELNGGAARHFHGVVTRFASTGWSDGFASYEATIHPWLWLLTRASNCRIFQDKTVPDIVKEVCEAYGGVVALSAGSLSGDYAAVPYCVQYRETDFNFVCRLLEAAGIYFYFKHEADTHTMVLADSYGAHAAIGGYGSLKFADGGQVGGQRGLREESVSSWAAGGQIQSSNYVLNDFDFEKASASSSGGLVATANIAAGFGQAAYEMFDYPGNYVLAADGNALARARIESLHGQCEQIEARTDARGLFPGGLFTLADHPRDDQNRPYLVTSLSVNVSGNDYTSGAGGGGGLDVQCSLTAVGKEFAYRPLPVIARPVVYGPQTAMVVGKAGEEIWTDKYGRIKVQFHWDRLGKEDENSSCWVRVAQGWAGKGWGAMSVPRIGMEVVVSFLEGDPDRPLVTGCVYNGDAMPPYPLPAEQTKSTIKTNSSKGGDGFNELRFEDKKGSEEIFVQAEKDYNRVVKNNDTLKVGFEKADPGDQTIGIKNDRSMDVGHDHKEHVANDHTLTIDNNQAIKVKVDQKLDVGGDQAVAIDGKQAVKVGTTIVIEAGTSIELKVGGSSIKI